MVSSEKKDDLMIDDVAKESKSGPGKFKIMLDKLKIKRKNKKIIPGESGTTKKKSGKLKIQKKWLVVGIGVLVILALAVAAYLFFTKDSAESLEAELKKAERTTSGKPLTLDFENILPFEKFSVALPGSEEKQTLSMMIQVEFTNPEVLDELLDRTLELREAIENVIRSKTMDEIRNINGKIVLKAEIINVLNGNLIRGKIRDIYITEFRVM